MKDAPKSDRYYPTPEEAMEWVEKHGDKIDAFGKMRVSDLVRRAVENRLGFCHDANVQQELSTGARSRQLLVLCVVSSEANKALVADYKGKSPASSFSLADLEGLEYSDLFIAAFKTSSLVILKLDAPDAVVLCGADAVTIKHMETVFSGYLEMIVTKDALIGEMKPKR